MTENAKIVGGLGGLYEVLCEGGEHIFCRARGSLKKDDKLLVGDLVTLEFEAGEAVIASCLPRKNALIRPPLANLDYLFIVTAATSPTPSYETIDKLTAIAVYNGIAPVIVITKADLSREDAERTASIYVACGFPVFTLGEGMETKTLSSYIENALAGGKNACFAGASGVGKSTLMNRLFSHLSLQTGRISEKIERGRHTTRSVKLYEVMGGYLADTPGFSMLDFLRFDFFALSDLPNTFPEFIPFYGGCRYADCTHTKEEECAIRLAVKEGRIPPTRKESYISLYDTLKAKKVYK